MTCSSNAWTIHFENSRGAISNTTKVSDSEYKTFNKVNSLGKDHPCKIFFQNDVKTVAKDSRT